MENNLEQLLEQGELAREKGDFQTALTVFDQLIIEAIKQDDIPQAINALGQHLLVYDRMYKETSKPAYLEMMYMDSQAGLRLAEKNNIHGQPLSAMLLRTAEYYLDTKDFKQAEKYYQNALDELITDSSTTNQQRAEYLGHLAEAVIYSGDVERALPIFEQAHEFLDNASENLRDFHYLIIRSGIFMREAYGLHLNNQTEKSKTILAKIEPLVKELKDKHDMDARYNQWVKLNSIINS